MFDWVVRQIQLVPPGSLGSLQLPQVPARPYDVLLRGMATEAEGVWAERAWLFMAVCRQIGIDPGLITYYQGTSARPWRPEPARASAAEADSQQWQGSPSRPSSGCARP